MEVPLTAGPSTGSVDGSGGCCRSTARQLQLCKLLYFLEGFSFASFGRFATLYYLSRGLDAHEIGLIEACRPGDRDRRRRPLRLARPPPRKKAVFLATRVASTTDKCCCCRRRSSAAASRASFALNAGGGFVGVGIGVLDAYTLDLLGERSTEYGQYRLWLAVSWGVGNAVMGNVAQIFGFDYNFILFGGLTAIELVLIAAVLPARTRSEVKLRADDARLHLQEEERAADASAAAAADRAAPSLRGACCCRRASSSSWRR